MKVLIDEDDAGELDLYRVAFAAKGHETVRAMNGEDRQSLQKRPCRADTNPRPAVRAPAV